MPNLTSSISFEETRCSAAKSQRLLSMLPERHCLFCCHFDTCKQLGNAKEILSIGIMPQRSELTLADRSHCGDFLAIFVAETNVSMSCTLLAYRNQEDASVGQLELVKDGHKNPLAGWKDVKWMRFLSHVVLLLSFSTSTLQPRGQVYGF